MFVPNLTGQIASTTGYDKNGQPAHADWRKCPFAFVNIAVGAEKTSVRADSSASRGSADELVALRAKILVAAFVSVKVGDKFAFEGQSYLVQGVHPRRDTMGRVDHLECDLEVLP